MCVYRASRPNFVQNSLNGKKVDDVRIVEISYFSPTTRATSVPMAPTDKPSLAERDRARFYPKTAAATITGPVNRDQNPIIGVGRTRGHLIRGY